MRKDAMRAAMYYSNSDLRLEERAKPEIGRGELLLRIEAVGICGSDCLEWYRRGRVPLVLGHEVAGAVAEVGDGLRMYKKNERIAVAHHVACGSCYWCLNGHETTCETLRRTNLDPGGFSEYARIPKINVEKGIFRLPEAMSFEEATFIEPLACAVRGQRLAGFRTGQSVLVIGSGIAGLLHIQLARAKGAGLLVSTDISEYRRQAAKRFGADMALSGDEEIGPILRSSNNGRLADLVILCTGAEEAVKQALLSVERGGTILFFAAAGEGISVEFSLNQIFWRNEITLTSSYAGSYNDYLEALELLRQNKISIKGMITHRLPLRDIAKGFQLVSEAKQSLKVIIEPQR